MSIVNQRMKAFVQETLREQSGSPRPIYRIAAEIKKLWPNVNFAAKPYLDAMMQISSVADTYGADDGRDIVLYFLSNAGTWKGPDAKRIKDELKAAMKIA